ncbi:carboxymuconolactone decarboxylase family protein [Luteipulveratus mongoliensis]|uniref:Carboxymuconolactone decarboxylase-like domain-containing protein n=1 Tax=Luteipulveratus mongoliensis TaxID=571913 RepID=A0A0K1JDN8_9MICO|nr:hypothetical protein [Luteipulveratus mongoliensis]AKU14832.1 hypothetical protein VV02_01370 [Luteipulveratus mongoliensis]
MFVQKPPGGPDVDRLYERDRAGDGYVTNYTQLWAWRPEVYDAFVQLRGMTTGPSTLSDRELAVLVCATVSTMRDSYCSYGWGEKLNALAGADLTAAIIAGGLPEELSARERAIAIWSRRVVADANGTSQKEVDALRDAGFEDREIVEATMFIGWRIAFSTVNDALGAGPDVQLAERVPAQVRDAVTFGRPVG